MYCKIRNAYSKLVAIIKCKMLAACINRQQNRKIQPKCCPERQYASISSKQDLRKCPITVRLTSEFHMCACAAKLRNIFSILQVNFFLITIKKNFFWKYCSKFKFWKIYRFWWQFKIQKNNVQIILENFKTHIKNIFVSALWKCDFCGVLRNASFFHHAQIERKSFMCPIFIKLKQKYFWNVH
jgi:hypothetical protein